MGLHHTRHTICALAGVALTLTLISCSQSATTQSEPALEVAAGPAEANDSPAVAIGDISPGIHNLFAVAPGVFSGSGPEGAAAFDSLRAMGVKTVISVDGARPELDLAHEHGMRYVHIPIGYDGMSAEQEVALAKALRDMPGPVYVHCHHGKHRGPTAAAVGLRGLGRMSGAEAAAFMHAAGTSESYPGLWACAADAEALSEAELDAYRGGLPEVQVVSGMVDSMVEIDRAWEGIKLVRSAGWATPADHPDLAPASLAGMLADHFRTLLDDPDSLAEGDVFVSAMQEAAFSASLLEAELAAADLDADRAESRYVAVRASCVDCHDRFRN